MNRMIPESIRIEAKL
uniref:Uncharacterized protein n=1 Tax=Rhizophora mucronata TaxID=61149 RepID=A0A2P2P9U9_RHIMU